MNRALGLGGLVLGFGGAFVGICAVLVGLRSNRKELVRLSRPYAGVVLFGAVLSVVAMQRGLITRDWTLKYVAEHGSSTTPPLFNVATMWSALEGSILLWGLVLAGYTVAGKWKRLDIRTPADIAGLKIRVSGSAAAAAVEALGATPVQMPAGEIYNSLQTGLIDGVITGASAIGDFRLDEVANSYTIGAPLGRISFYLVMNADRYNSLPDGERAALDTIIGRPLSALAEAGWNARAAQVLEQISSTGDNTVYTLTDDEVAAFGALTYPVREAVISGIDGGEDVLHTMQGDM